MLLYVNGLHGINYSLIRAAIPSIARNASPESLIEVIRVIANGNSLLSPSITRRLIAKFVQAKISKDYTDNLQQLTSREVEILKLVAEGKSNFEVAEDLLIGEATVRTHVSNLLGKLGLRDRVQLVVFAYESGLVQPGI